MPVSSQTASSSSSDAACASGSMGSAKGSRSLFLLRARLREKMFPGLLDGLPADDRLRPEEAKMEMMKRPGGRASIHRITE